jgi:hypothetical protein
MGLRVEGVWWWFGDFDLLAIAAAQGETSLRWISQPISTRQVQPKAYVGWIERVSKRYIHISPDHNSKTHHRHQLRNRRPRHPQLVYHRWQHSTDAPPANRMANPQQRESKKSRILEKSLSLRPIPRLRSRSRLGSRQVGDDGAFLVLGEELARVGIIGQEEVGVDAAEDGGGAFAGGGVRGLGTGGVGRMEVGWTATYRINIHLQPARPATPFMKLMANASKPLIVPLNIPQT